MKISKTDKNKNKVHSFLLGEQLCQLLEAFKWKRFKGGQFYSRMVSIFGFRVYAIKKCMFSESRMHERRNLKIDLRHLAAHKQQKMVDLYAKAGDLATIKIIKDNLKVPNLRF